MADEVLAPLVQAQLHKRGIAIDERLPRLCALLKDRCDTTVMLADWVAKFYADVTPDAAELTQHVTDAIRPALQLLVEKLSACSWDKAAIAATIKEVLAAQAIKMPQLAMPVRVLVMGTAQTPSLDAVLELCEREKVISRLRAA
jgi:glutamyl-tRNA synthetase